MIPFGSIGMAASATATAIEGIEDQIDAETDEETILSDDERERLTRIFRRESWVSHNDLRVDVADRIFRTVVGDETLEVDQYYLFTCGYLNTVRGERERTVGSYHRSVDNDDLFLLGERYDETVEGGVDVQAVFSAEAIVGGAYVNTITAGYLRLAAWVDFLVWGGWLEADAIRTELAAAIVRSHFAYAHIAPVRTTLASRLIDDYQARVEDFAVYNRIGTTYNYAGAPGGGIENEA